MPAPTTTTVSSKAIGGKGHCVNRDRDGFNESRMRKRHVIRQLIGDACGNGHILGESARAPEIGRGNSYDFAMITQVHLASATVKALAAKDGGVERNLVARLKSSHCRAH